MNRCYNTETSSHKNHQQQISSCLRSPGVLLRQKSFHTLNELSRICHITRNAASNTRRSAKHNRFRYSVDDNILPPNTLTQQQEQKEKEKKFKDHFEHFNLRLSTTHHSEYDHDYYHDNGYDFDCDYDHDHENGNGNANANANECDNDRRDVASDNEFVVLRNRTAENQNNNRNSYFNRSLKYYNHIEYHNNSKKNNNQNNNNNNNNKCANSISGKSESKNKTHTHKAHEGNKSKFHHELLSHDQFERDNPILHVNNNNNSSNNNNIKNITSNNSTPFRWSTQPLSNHVSVAKIRTAISCTPQDLREMEFLLPQHHSATTTHHNNNNNNNNSSTNSNNKHNNTNGTQHHQSSTSIAEQASKLLHISRHSQSQIATSATHNGPNPTDDDRTTDGGNENCPQNLAIHRQPAHARTKCGSTPPHRTKMSKKQLKLAQAQLDKLTQINLHLHALFSAVEHGHLDKARTILESTDVDVNSINADGLSALDVAVLSNNRSMTKMLLQRGAVEGTQFSNDTIGTKLNGLLKDAESRIHDLSGPADTPVPPIFTSRPSISSIIIGNTGSSVTGCTGNEIDKQIGIWERRVKGLRRMLLGWDQTTRPDAPASVAVDVTGENSIALQILEPFEGAIGTKFKVQWSTRADFSNVVGEREIIDWSSFHGSMGASFNISGLTQGRRYFVRAACGNIKGWGSYKTSVPASVVPSSWRDLNNREDRYLGRQRALDNLFTAVRLARPADVSELSLETTNVQRRNPKKKTTIKQLFSVASKFQKNLRRGIYLASIIYCEDKVLVTSEDFLPVIEIDETYPSSLHSDYHWLMKVACTWDDVKSLRTDMERNLTSAVHFRTKLLSAVCQMQSALGINDLGQLYYKPLRDSHGTVVLTCIQSVRSQKNVSILNSRWLPVNKLQKKVVALLEDYNINDMLISSISEQMHYHQASMQRLAPGLYLGYLKLQCSVDQIQVVVPVKTPNVLPHCKVRENSHITAEEWQILKRSNNTDVGGCAMNLPLPLEFSVGTETTTEGQRLFLYDLTNAAHKLFTYMNIKPQDAATHRLYDIEVIEHSKDISFLIICPSVELTCAAPGQSELLLQRDDLASLSIQAFEMIHLRTYQTGIIQKYARLSCILELDTALANHSQREAFSTTELQTARERLAKLQELSANLNMVWKSVRWLMDVISFARDKTAQPTLAMREILDFSHVRSNEQGNYSSSNKQQLLQLPIRDVKFTKSGSGRGSWPGPAGNSGSNNSSTGCLEAEHSKSEQNLGHSAVTPTTLSPSPQTAVTTQAPTDHNDSQLLKISKEPTSDVSLRKNSGDSVASQSYYSGAESAASSSNELGAIFAIPPSRSDDTLALASNESSMHARAASSAQRKRTSSNITYTNTTTPLITVHCSSSAPYLAHDLHSSNLSLQSSTIYAPMETSTTLSSIGESKSKTKAASSASLRESTSSNYLKSTLSALQSEIKTATCEERVASSTKSLSKPSSEEEVAAAGHYVPSEQASTSGGAAAPISSGIIQVYTAYNTGLASGTSLKLHVTPRTTAREVINLVVKQLNMAAVLKGNNGPIYTTEMLDNFCLVAVIGARERCLRDDFKPLQLQNPWKKGRLYVRQKHELLAAIEHSNRKSHLI